MPKVPPEVERREQLGSSAASQPKPPAVPPAPAPVRQATAKPDMEGWTEIPAPILFKFEAPGEWVEGRLQRIDRVEVKSKSCNQYTIQGKSCNTHEGHIEVIKILGTYDIDTKLQMGYVGKIVQIVYARDRPDIASKGNPMREFLVRVKNETPKAAAFSDGTQITDEDIPF